jgi:hypothetical protein
MPGYGSLIVGYRQGDRRRLRIADEYGLDSTEVAGCVSCGAPTFFVKSGQDAYRARDPVVACQACMDRWGDEIRRSL